MFKASVVKNEDGNTSVMLLMSCNGETPFIDGAEYNVEATEIISEASNSEEVIALDQELPNTRQDESAESHT